MAMKRTIANLVTEFTVGGLKAFRAQIARIAGFVRGAFKAVSTSAPMKGLVLGAQAATAALRSTTRMAAVLGRTLAGIGKKAVLGVGAGLLGSGGSLAFLKKGITDSQGFIQEMEKVAAAVDMPIEKMAEFSANAERYGLELEDIRQAMTQFYGVAGQAALGGNEYTETFKRLGLDMSLAENKALSMSDLFAKFAKQMAKISGNQKTYALSQIFGDDDATRVAKIVDAMGKMNRGISSLPEGEYTSQYLANLQDDPAKAALDKAKASGSLITEKDLALSREMKGATTELTQSWRGLKMEIFRAFGKPFLLMLQAAAAWITKWRFYIVAYMLVGVRKLVSLIHDAVVIFGNKRPLQQIRNNWLFTLKAILLAAWNMAKVIGGLIVLLYRVADAMVLRSSGKTILEWLQTMTTGNVVAFFTRVWNYVVVIFKAISAVIDDFFDVIAGRDGDITTGIGLKMMQWRNAIVGWVTNAWSVVKPILDAVWYALTQIYAGLSSGQIDMGANSWRNFGAMVRVAFDWLVGFGTALYAVFALQQNATGAFAWLNVVRDWIFTMWAELQIAIGWFHALFDAVDAFLRQFGIDLKATLLFIGLLQLTGVGGLLSLVFGGIGLVINGLKGMFALFGSRLFVAAFTGSLNVIRIALSTLGIFISTFATTVISGLAAAFGTGGLGASLVASLAGVGTMIAGFLLSGAFLGVVVAAAAFIGAKIGEALANAIYPVATKMPEIMPLDANGRPLTFEQAKGRWDAWQLKNANKGINHEIAAAANYPDSQQHLGDVNINVGGKSYPMKASPDVWEDLQRNKEFGAGSFLF